MKREIPLLLIAFCCQGVGIVRLRFEHVRNDALDVLVDAPDIVERRKEDLISMRVHGSGAEQASGSQLVLQDPMVFFTWTEHQTMKGNEHSVIAAAGIVPKPWHRFSPLQHDVVVVNEVGSDFVRPNEHSIGRPLL